MEVYRCIKTRRSIRKFKPEQIRDIDRDKILTAATFAPSGSNSQSWQFTAIQKQDVLLALNEEVREGFARLQLSNNEYPAKIRAKLGARKNNYNFYYHAPTLIVCSNVPHYPNAMADCAAATENMMLTAHSLGLGSCWINQLTWLSQDETLRKYLEIIGIPKEHVICSAVAIGYPDCENPEPPARKENTIKIV
jgi:nitroreductase